MKLRPWMVRLALATSLFQTATSAQTQEAENGSALLKEGRLQAAREAFEQKLARDSSDVAALEGEVSASERLALDALREQRADDALRALLRAQQYAPHHARLLYDLGILEDQMGLYRDAENSLDEAEAQNPGDPNVVYGMARVKMDLGQLAEAEEKMKAYLSLRPNDASAHYGLGRIYQIGLRLDEAAVEFKHSAELQPVQTEAYYELGDIALKQGNTDEAIMQFGKVLDRDAKHGGALEGLGEAYFKKKNYMQARAQLEKAIASSPGYSPSHYYLGLTLARLGNKTDSEQELREAARLADEENKKAAGRLQILQKVPSGSTRTSP